MGLKTGDKARYFRERRKKHRRRARARVLRKELTEKTTEAAANDPPST
jgi:hypothetical protein